MMKCSVLLSFLIAGAGFLPAPAQNPKAVKKAIMQEQEFRYELLNLNPVQKIRTDTRSEGFNYAANQVRFTDRSELTTDIEAFLNEKLAEQVKTLTEKYIGENDREEVSMEPVQIQVFKFGGDMFADVVFTPFNSAPNSFIQYYHWLSSIPQKKSLGVYTSAVQGTDCFGDYNNDGLLDFLDFNWESGNVTQLYTFDAASASFHIRPDYRLVLKDITNGYYPRILNTSSVAIHEKGTWITLTGGKK